MSEEVERKFLVTDEGYKKNAEKRYIRQGYLSTTESRSVRVRIIDNKAKLTIKGKTKGATRSEFEYDIPLEEAEIILKKLCRKPLIEKYRFLVQYEGNTWEVDEFLGANEGLTIAEIELENEEQSFKKPRWIGAEVTDKPEYYNVNLIRKPYRKWQNKNN